MPAERLAHWSRKRRERLSEDLDLLLGDVCTNWGFCNALTGESLLAKHDPIKASDFATDVLYAEGIEPRHLPYRAALEKAFIARYGKSISSHDYDPGMPVSPEFPETTEL